MIIWDLFCGAGGFSLGFAGKDNVVIGFDNNTLALKTYKYNLSKVYRESFTVNSDIKKLEITFISGDLVWLLINGEKKCFPKPDTLIGSPPCQDFSVANRFKRMDTTLVEKFLEIKNVINPKYWVMEEVPAVGKIGEKKGWFKPRYLKACEFNLPHMRKRLFAGNYPPPIKKHYKGIETGFYYPTITSAGADGGSNSRKAFKKRIETKKMLKTPIAQIRGYGHGKEDREKLKEMFTELGGMFPTPVTTGNDRDHSTKAGGLNTYSTVRKKIEKFTDVITPELCAWIMGFPSWYKFLGSKTQQYKQIGNAVCPPISKAIYDAILNPPLTTRDIK
jgi:DNA (cytosine-5)-methyltransferase 1